MFARCSFRGLLPLCLGSLGFHWFHTYRCTTRPGLGSGHSTTPADRSSDRAIYSNWHYR